MSASQWTSWICFQVGFSMYTATSPGLWDETLAASFLHVSSQLGSTVMTCTSFQLDRLTVGSFKTIIWTDSCKWDIPTMAFMTSSSCCMIFNPEVTTLLSFLSITLDSLDIKAPNSAHGLCSVFTSSFTAVATALDPVVPLGSLSSSLLRSMYLLGCIVKALAKWALQVFQGYFLLLPKP